MPHKIKFKLVHVSGHDEGINPLELEIHNPVIQGWISARFCLFPQELVFKLERRTRVRKLQILAHQYLIPSKVELFIGEGPSPSSLDPSSIGSGGSVRYNRLGYIALSDNEKTGFKARELKSVHVDAIGLYLKIVVYKNHVNKYNLYNQVGLVAINVIGDTVAKKKGGGVSDATNPEAQAAIIDQYIPGFSFDTSKQGFNPREDPLTLGAINNRPDYISPLDDLAFDMYQDPQVASIIRKLDKRKAQAISEEQFELAKKIKQAMVDLQKVGERLGKYEVEKRRALEQEDFDLAQQKKQHMEEYRAHIQQQLQYHSLLDPHHPNTSAAKPLPPAKLRTPTPPLRTQLKPISPPLPTAKAVTPPMPESPAVSPVPPPADTYDERPLPVRRSPSPPGDYVSPRTGGLDESVGGDSSSGEPEPMSEKQVREAQAVIDVFGLKMVTGAYSKQWSYREDALLAVYKILEETPTVLEEMQQSGVDERDLRQARSNMVRNAIFLCRRAILDKVMAVFAASLKLLRMILVEFIPKHSLDRTDTIYAVEKTLPNLVSRTGETSVRQRSGAKEFISDMALMREVKPLQIVPHYCTLPFDKTVPTRLATSRCEIVEQLVRDLGIGTGSHGGQGTARGAAGTSGLTLDNAMTFCVAALEHNAKEVRDVASRIIVDVYNVRGDPVRNYLPIDNDNTRKNVLYKHLFEAFDRIDYQGGVAPGGGMHTQRSDRPPPNSKPNTVRVSKQQPAEKPYADQLDVGAGAGSTSKSVRSKASPSEAAGQDDMSVLLDNMCIFCGERNEAFNEEGLDLHYWKECAMLRRCQHCKQVVEIANLTAHLLTECESKQSFSKCPRCTEAIPNTDYDPHTKAKTCNAAKPDKQANHCPLCHINFAPGEEGWKMHLMGKEGCKENPRRLPALNRAKNSSSPKKGAARGGASAIGGNTGPGGGAGSSVSRAPIASAATGGGTAGPPQSQRSPIKQVTPRK
ncbi:centrosomal protein of 104 kDa-like isoform X2 [Convolutriloba macropyga]|uniref:centrosomal protein of 104 kDa-like isoform X2 n=1 Tax=Convolutriloba macropyga TaxID=536237 RepID=UPI003F51F68D